MDLLSLAAITKELECPVCEKYMVRQISLCINGHSLCIVCKSSLTSNHCPICRQGFSKGRNYSMEKLASVCIFPCRNTGCYENLKGADINNHEKRCNFGEHPCMLASFTGCGWNGVQAEDKQHILNKHVNFTKNFQVIKQPDSAELRYNKILIQVKFVENEVFVVFLGYDLVNCTFSAVHNNFEIALTSTYKLSVNCRNLSGIAVAELRSTVPCISRDHISLGTAFTGQRIVFSKEMIDLYFKSNNNAHCFDVSVDSE